MNKKLLAALTLMAGQAMAMEAMELAIDDERAIPTDITEKKVVITIQNQERELSPKVIPLIGALAGFYVKDTPLQMSPITMVNLDIWQLIENQLERVYEITQGNQQVRDEIIANYSQLNNTSFIDLIKVIDFLDIPLLKKITLEVAQNKLNFDEILALPEYLGNEIIKRKALSIAGPVLTKEIAVCCNLTPLWLFALIKSSVTLVCVTPDGPIVSGSWDKTVRIWDMNGKQLAVCSGHEEEVTSVCSSPNGKSVSGSYDKTVRIWDMNGKELAVCRGHEGTITLVCVTPDGKIVSGSWDKIVRVWDMNGKDLAVCRGHKEVVWSVCITHDNKIISGSGDKTVRIWDMDGNQLVVCKGHEKEVTSVCVTDDNKIVSGSEDKTVRIWDMNGQELTVCRGHKKEVWSVCVTPDGTIVSGSWDKTVRIWDMNGKELAVCRGHKNPCTSVCFTSDGKIISGSYDKTVRIWDMNGKQLAVCSGHEGAVLSVCVTPDGKIVSGSYDKTVRVWNSNLLNRLSVMNREQAQAICKILQLSACTTRKEKKQCWEEIGKVFGDELLSNLSKWWSSGRAIRVMIFILPLSLWLFGAKVYHPDILWEHAILALLIYGVLFISHD